MTESIQYYIDLHSTMDELDDFFDCALGQEITCAGENDFEEFFDNHCINETGENPPLMKCPPTEETNLSPKRKAKRPKNEKGTTFKVMQEKKINVEEISKELLFFQSCCKLSCYMWMTVQIIMFCRAQYILLPCFEDRRTWLARKMDEMSVGPATFSYSVDVLSSERRKSCAKAWRFAYGVPKTTHKRAMRKRSNHRPNNKKGKGKFDSAATFFIVWLLAFAQRVGDKLPFGDGNGSCTQIRLPFPNKKMVYNIYKNFEMNDNITKVDPIIHYSTAVLAWKEDPQAKHIKLAKHKEGFSKCDICSAYDRKIEKQMTISAREALDLEFYSHIAETRKERQHAQYYSAKYKAISKPDECMSIIMDAMDQRKTCVPFFSNPPKCIGSDYVLKTKLTASIVHGHGTYLFWTTEQIKHDSNLTIECLRRTLLKYEEEKGKLPPILYLQMDNGPDQKSKQFLAFLAYLVESGVFHKIKVSYLIVGHTHEDIDQYFSCISRYIRKTLKQLLSVNCLVDALQTCFKTPGCIPRCIEQIQFCFDTQILSEKFLDPHFARFDLDEKTSNKTHYMKLTRNKQGKAVLQYKLKRYCDALYPRKFSVHDEFHCDKLGKGRVIEVQPMKDALTKIKYWNYTVVFGSTNSSTTEIFQLPSDESTILMFPNSNPCDLPRSFPLAPFKGSVEETLGEQKKGVDSILRKLEFDQEYPAQSKNWQNFWNAIPNDIESLPIAQLPHFSVPNQQLEPLKAPQKPFSLHIDDGVRAVEPVQHSNFKASHRKRKMRDFESSIERVDPLKQGEIVVVNLVPQESPWYTLPFVIAEIEKDISDLDTTDPDCQFEVQVYRTKDKKNSLSKAFVKWQGEDNVYWKPTIERGMVLSTVSFRPKSKKLSLESLQFIQKHHMNSSNCN